MKIWKKYRYVVALIVVIWIVIEFLQFVNEAYSPYLP